MSATPDRLRKIFDLSPLIDGTHSTRLQLLPDGYVLLDPTPTEAKIIELYAAECLRIKPPLTDVECQRAGE